MAVIYWNHGATKQLIIETNDDNAINGQRANAILLMCELYNIIIMSMSY